MDPEHERLLQRNYWRLERCIADVDGVIAGMYSGEILTRALKDQINQENMSKVNRLRALMDLLPFRGAKVFDSFCDVLFENEEFTAVEYLKPELMRKNQDGSASECLKPQQVSQSHLCPNYSGQKVHYTFHHKSTVLPKVWPDPNHHNPQNITVQKVFSTNKFMTSLFQESAKDNVEKMDSGVPVLSSKSSGENIPVNDNAASTPQQPVISSAYEDTFEEKHEPISEAEKLKIEADKLISSKADIFVAMSTLPGYTSWRNREFGTWFSQAVAYVFSNFAYSHDLCSLMTKVNCLIGRAETYHGHKQMSIYKSSLTKDFYFFPGLSK